MKPDKKKRNLDREEPKLNVFVCLNNLNRANKIKVMTTFESSLQALEQPQSSVVKTKRKANSND